MRSKSTLVMGILLTFLFASTVFAQPAKAQLIQLSVGGKTLKTKGLLVDGSTLVDVGELSEEMGFEYSAESHEGITVVFGENKLSFAPKCERATINGHEIWRPLAADMEAGAHIMVSLRFLLENLGFKIDWVQAETPEVRINKVKENEVAIATLRERLVTSTLEIDVQYPKLVGLDAANDANEYFASRPEDTLKSAYKSDEDMRLSEHKWATQAVLNYAVTYNQNGLISLLFDDYLYTGGAHGGTYREGYTLNLDNGNRLNLADVFNPGADYITVISEHVSEQIEDLELEPLVEFTKIDENHDFYIKDGNLIIYFQQYELMPYAWGFPEFAIPFSELADILNPAFSAIAK